MDPSPASNPARAADEHLPGLLVSPSWLRERLGSPAVRVVDLREAAEYRGGHIPGAAQLDLSELGGSVGDMDNVLLPANEFGALMGARGISNGQAVVAYDDQWGLAAARLAWALHRHGHARVAVLDGGWDRWREEGGPVARGEERIPPGHFAAGAASDVGEAVYADYDHIVRRLGSLGTVLVDTRTQREFDQGHLPGAVSWDWFNAVPAESWNVSRDPAELRTEWQRLGIDPSEEVIVYCRSGMRAAHTYLVLRNAGFSRVRLYDGSWQEWSMKKKEQAGGD